MGTGGRPNIGAVKTGLEHTAQANKAHTDRVSYRSLHNRSQVRVLLEKYMDLTGFRAVGCGVFSKYG